MSRPPLEDGQKGVILQRDKKTYAIAPHMPCGVTTPAMLRKIADAAEKYHAKAIKCTSAERIAIIGLDPKDIDAAWQDLGGKPGHMVGSRVRSVRACPGTEFCKRGRQDSLGVGLQLDAKYHGKELPGKMKIGVSGCPNQCAETCIKDIGLVGFPAGWLLFVGGCGGACPRLAKQLLDEEISTERALQLIDAIITFFAQNARESERLGELIERLTMKVFKHKLGLA